MAPIVGAAIAGLSYRFITGESGVELVAGTGQDPDSAVTTAGEQATLAGTQTPAEIRSDPTNPTASAPAGTGPDPGGAEAALAATAAPPAS